MRGNRKRLIIALTGASGIEYGIRTVRYLLETGNEVHMIISRNGYRVMEYECSLDAGKLLGEMSETALSGGGFLKVYEDDDIFASVSSGSFNTDGMAIVPCSMATLGKIAAGSLGTLIGRAADVCLKERRKLVLVPRETPLSTIHLKNMLALSETGAVMLPAMPGFYGKPESVSDMIDFIAGRVMNMLGVKNSLNPEWGMGTDIE